MGKTPPRPEHPWLKPPGPVAAGLKIGLLGGSFNPAHEGHLHVSETALKASGGDVLTMSGVSGDGVQEVLRALAKAVTRNRKRQNRTTHGLTWSP